MQNIDNIETTLFIEEKINKSFQENIILMNETSHTYFFASSNFIDKML